MTRHRHRPKNAPGGYPGGYPGPEERAQIIQRRRELDMQMIHYLVQGLPSDDPHYAQLVRQYGAQEVAAALQNYSKTAEEHDTLLDEPYSYRKYRQAFAVFGGQRRYLPAAEYFDLQMEFMKLFFPRAMLSDPPFQPPSLRESELYDLLLAEVDYWRDITPPSIPPRPAEYPAPHLTYSAELRALFEIGPFPAPAQIARLASPVSKWDHLTAEIIHLLYAPDLLHGWPGDASAWAPMHALSLLGQLRAVETSVHLLKLMYEPNDWLSDLLPVTWSSMGPGVTGFLWVILKDGLRPEKHRGQAVFGLKKLAESHPAQRSLVIDGLIQHLKTLRDDTPSLNAYIIHALDTLKAPQAQATIRNLFKKGWVNEKIVSASDPQRVSG